MNRIAPARPLSLARSYRALLLALVLLGLVGPLVGCATTRTVTIIPTPRDAMIKIDGVERGRGEVTEELVYRNAGDVHRIEASRMGYKMVVRQLTRDDAHGIIELSLPPQTRRIDLAIKPVPGVVKINGETVSDGPVSVLSRTLEFTVDQRNNWTSYTVTAERENFRPAQVNVTWTDTEQFYTLEMRPLQKDLSINSTPSGAQAYLDGVELGTTPVVAAGQAFPFNLDTNAFEPRVLRLEKPGYDPVELEIAWDEGKTDYEINLNEKQKVVRITTDPPDAEVTIEGAKPTERGPMTKYALSFPPINERGELQTYTGTARMKPVGDREWAPATFTIGWDGGKSDYHIELEEILTRDVATIVPTIRRSTEPRGWEVVPERVVTLAMKDRNEPPGGGGQPVLVAQASADASLGAIAVSPDGRRLLYTELIGTERADFRSQMFVVNTDNAKTKDIITDGRTLDIMPSFSPDGRQILFSSNRAGRRMQIWSMSATGGPLVTRMVTSETHDLWPSLDSDPRPRLFYQAMVDTRDGPQIFVTPVNTTMQTEISRLGGTQPRVSPTNDAVLFCAVNEETGKRDVYRMSDSGGDVQNLTNTPDADECDPAWSRDGRMVAFASDRGEDAQGRRNYDIWVLDLGKPDAPTRVTANGSHDDTPVFDPRDPRGRGVYFRSNRGGDWAVWRLSLR